jgi:hypothetical protein
MKFGRTRTFIIALSAIVVLVAVVWVVVPLARERSQYVSMGTQWLALLKEYPVFSSHETGYPADVRFHYAGPTDDNLKKLRDMYDLQTVAGTGSEIDRIINLMSWVYGLAEHANEPSIPTERNAFAFIHMAKVEQRQINCYMKTVILNEVYLSMGFCSRHTHLLPHSHEESESHFVTSVYSRTLGKWILMDPDFGVYVTDEKGNILGVMEIRRRMIAGEPLKVNQPGRSSLAVTWGDVCNYIKGADYFWFLSKFLFKVRCPENSVFAQDSRPSREYFELIPDGYQEELLREPRMADRGKKIFSINDEHAFWLEPPGSSN